MNKAWVGVDAGKEFHWAHVLDALGTELLSRKVENDEADIARLLDEALSLAEGIGWAVDQPGGSAALLLALLWERNQRVFYVPGLSVDRARETYRALSPRPMLVMPTSSPTPGANEARPRRAGGG
jgi:Transposase